MDRERSHLVVEDLNNGSFEYDDDDDRQECIRSIQEKLKEYCWYFQQYLYVSNADLNADYFVTSYSNLKKQPAATSDNLSNVQNQLSSNAKAIDPKESTFIYRDDLFPIVATAQTPLRRALEKFNWFRRCSFFRYEPENNNRYH